MTVRAPATEAAPLGIAAVGGVHRLERTVVDRTVASPERLAFEAAPILGAGLRQEREPPRYFEGRWLDVDAYPALTADETARYEAIVAQAKRETAGGAREARAAYVDLEADKLADATGIDRESALRLVVTRAHGDLGPDDVIHFQRFGAVAVRDVLADQARFEGESCADPAEPEYGAAPGEIATSKAKFYTRKKHGEGGRTVIHSQAHGGRTYFLHDAEGHAEAAARADHAEKRERRQANGAPAGHPVIRIAAGEANQICTELADAFLRGTAPIYRRGRMAVRAAREDEVGAPDDSGTRRPHEALTLRPLTPAILLSDAARFADLVKYSKREKGWIAVDMPKALAETFCALATEQPALPALAGIAEVPIMRADGKPATTPGYDPDSHMLIAGDDWRGLDVPARPTRHDARGALDALRESLRGFPFVDDVSRAIPWP